MSAYHVVLVHFPIALWMVAALAIVIRAFNDRTLGQAMDCTLPVLLVLGVAIGLIAYLVGLAIWPWETLSSTPMGRNHMLTATWSLAYFALLAFIRWRHGARIWEGISRWIMVILAGIGVTLVGITGTLGGHLVGNYTEVGDVLRVLGWEIYTTYHVPNITLLVIAAVSIVLVAMAFLGRNRSTA
jgi:uncharacterized membrane protein